MMFRSIVVISLLVSAATLFAQEVEFRSKKYPNGNLRYEGWFVGEKPVKQVKRYHENGQLWVDQVFDDKGGSKVTAYDGGGNLMAEGQYVAEKRDGDWKFYASNGALILTEHYEMGLLDGDCRIYDAKGNLMDYVFYKNGVMDSVRLQYFPNGNVVAKFFYKDGQLNGEYRSYYYDGSPEFVGNYLNGKKEGWWYYTSDVGVMDSLFYENGVSAEMEQMIRAESDSSDFTNQYFVDPEEYMNNPMDYLPF